MKDDMKKLQRTTTHVLSFIFSLLASAFMMTAHGSNGTCANETVYSSLVNGSFENGLTAWSYNSGMYTIGGSPAIGVDGASAGDLGGGGVTGTKVWQSVTALPGGNYALSFYSAVNGSLNDVAVGRVEVEDTDSNIIASLTFTNVCPGSVYDTNGFTLHTLSFTTSSNTTCMTIRFLDLTPNGATIDLAIDDVVLGIATAPPIPGLISWWPGEGNANDVIGTNNGVLQNGLGFAAGEVGQGFNFDGIDDTITVPPSSSLDVGTNNVGFTLECWINPTDVISQHPLFEWMGESNNLSDNGVLFWAPAGDAKTLCGNILDTTAQSHIITSPVVLQTNVFQHVALTFDKASGIANIYYNGALVQTASLGTYFTPKTSNALLLGRRAATDNWFFSGILDEPSLYGRALSSNEIAAIYNAGSAGKTIPTLPLITKQPASQTVGSGSNVTFSVSATGVAPLGYQWSEGITAITGATNATLTLVGVQTADAGTYFVTVSNLFGSVTSSNATLSVVGLAPNIITQPHGSTVYAGVGVTFSVVAGGSLPLSYQWQLNSSNISGATSASYSIASVAGTDAGNYSVVVTNLYGSVTSSNAALVVTVPALTMSDDFEPGIDLTQWSAFSGTVLATNYGGYVSPTHSLWFGGTGSRSATTHLLNTVAGGQIAFYLRLAYGSSSTWEMPDLPGEGITLEYSTNLGTNWVAITNYIVLTPYTNWSSQSITIPVGAKAPATLFRWRQLSNSGAGFDNWALDDINIGANVSGNAPQITVQPANKTVAVGSSTSFSVTAVGTSPLNYQWRIGVSNIFGATNATLALPNVQLASAGTYQVTVTNLYGSVNSSNAVLTVTNAIAGTAPSITGQPANRTVAVGSSASFSVTATGTAPLKYQWTLNGTGIFKATNATLALSNVHLTNAGTYRVTVTNLYGSVDSSNAVLTVTNVPVTGVCASETVYSSLVNGSFENGLTGWSYNSGMFTIGTAGTPIGVDGSYSGDLGGGGVTGTKVWQSVAALPGTNYVLSFYSGCNGSSNDVAVGRVEVEDTSGTIIASQGFTNVCPGSVFDTNGFTLHSLSFTTSSSATCMTIRFLDLTPNAATIDLAIDDVTLSAVTGPVIPGLISWWPGEGNANDVVGNNNGVLQNGLGFATGEVGQGFKFDGIDDTITVPASSSLDVGTDNVGFTLECWINPADVNSQHPLFEWMGESNNLDDIGVHFWAPAGDAGTLYANIVGPSAISHTITSPVVLQTNVFQHVALTFDNASGVASLYYNGALVQTASMGTNFTPKTSNALLIGRRHSSDDWYFKGILDEPSLYGRALSAGEIAAIYNAGHAGKGAPAGTSPSVAAQPADQTVAVGSSASFSVTATGTPTLQYQWSKGATGISGATNATLALSNAQLSDAGIYNVTVTNLYGSITSSNASLTVTNVPAAGVCASATVYSSLVNGSFENGLTGWSYNSGMFTIGTAGTPIGVDGSYSGDLGGGGVSGTKVWQSVAALPNTNYTLSFYSAVNGSLNDVTIGRVEVEDTSGTIIASQTFTNVCTTSVFDPTSFTLNTLLFTTSSNATCMTIRFLDLTPNAATIDLAIDDVVLERTGTPSIPGLISWWPGEGNANDVVGTNNGVLLGVGFGTGEVGQAFVFSANSTNTVRVPASDSLDVGNDQGFTVELWVNPASAPLNSNVPLVEWNDDTYWGVHLAVDNSGGPGDLYANVVDSGGGWHFLNSGGGVVQSNVWQHVALTYDKASGQGVLYYNGTVVASQNLGSYTPRTAGRNVYFGRRVAPTGDQATFEGSLDEVSLYGRALSSNEIAAIYNAGAAGKTTSMPHRLVLPKAMASPTLSVSVSGGNIVLTWPAWAAGFTVQTSDLTMPLDWSDLSVTIQTNGSNVQAIIPMNPAQKAFRLQHP